MADARQTWDPERYARQARFVADLAGPVVALLDPRPGERILDLGCGDGFLTARLAEQGGKMVGVDASLPQVEAACRAGIEAVVGRAEDLAFDADFDAVFSNAALHWVRDADAAIAGVWRALKPGGRFAAELGGDGCVAAIRGALAEALRRRNLNFADWNPWYFPTAEEYGGRLTRAGFRVETIGVFPRPTPLPGSLRTWLETFAQSFTSALPEPDRPGFLLEVEEALRPQLCGADGRWTADYTRLRFLARKPDQA